MFAHTFLGCWCLCVKISVLLSRMIIWRGLLLRLPTDMSRYGAEVEGEGVITSSGVVGSGHYWRGSIGFDPQ